MSFVIYVHVRYTGVSSVLAEKAFISRENIYFKRRHIHPFFLQQKSESVC